MTSALGGLHIEWARLFVHALADAGIRDVVLSPGSRSTPLVLAAAGEARVRCHPIVDERSAAFFALGQARATGRPSALVCTSGTAGAHHLPAVIEAHQTHTPLLVVTADRPWELQDAAAAQTIDQVKLFGGFVRHFAELGVPDDTPGALAAVTRIAAQAAFRTTWPTPGPVHVNARFRKPLEPVRRDGEPWRAELDLLLARPAPRAVAPRAIPDDSVIEALAERCARAERGLIVCGPAPLGPDPERLREAVLELARRTGFPLLAEATSQLRFGGAGPTRCSVFGAILASPAFAAAHGADLILELGAPPTSAGYARYLAASPDCPRFVVAPHGWNDPTSRATALVMAEPVDVARALSARLGERPRPSAWAEAFAAADRRALAVVEAELASGVLTEGLVARSVVHACPAGSLLAIGNSLPVRHLDTYCPAGDRALGVLHQRGASGIDGLVSGALGARSVSASPVTLLLGDLSLLHDLGGLALAREVPGPFVAVVVQNGGGRIFDQLPLAGAIDAPALMERCFTMPQPLDLAHAAALFGMAFARASTPPELADALARAHAGSGATLIEAVVLPGDARLRAARIQRWDQDSSDQD